MNRNFVIVGAALAALWHSTALAQDTIDIKVGVLNDRSGTYADLSGPGSDIAAQMAIDDFGAAEKGINVEIVGADHQNKADIASSIARRWFDQDGVDIIMDLPTSSAAFAVSDLGRQNNKLVIVTGGGSSDLTGTKCAPSTFHWAYDTWSLAHGTGSALVEQGLDTWYFLTADYAFGHSLERDTSAIVTEAGGTVLGAIRHPFPGQDFSSFLLQAQSSGAKVIGLANAGADTINSIKQASEFGITQSGQTLAGLLIFISDVHALGLQSAQGLVLTESFYWDHNDETRAWSRRFAERFGGTMPTMSHAGMYSAMMHYLKAVDATRSKDTATIVAKMKEMPTQDVVFGAGRLREDGRKIHDMYLFRVKTPQQSSGPWDYYETVATIPAEEAFRPIEDGGCPLLSK
ncbi:ABC transporter substrate-binding protein [Aureimonas jatrophae]|uniref:Amino acid/amide ABC transporter substrate-binding protein, HAAT family n=1 Tax=Aureimonas jatrophae TaxID=1166073 RepID=A0A1H0EH03_9HYPH|nr:ABC transporter substrate-binding protein [Aureimonas jatrophae]MBB3952838.1 branched-chain amino acid transport system substrate-binding protein [Aureimonas jatrophae]SDN81638.1 amino acid/amide ABC transporter substrate-binding protein, HAAT family [Aureimonas jatrophae]